jgi:hypothetical protein
LVTSTLCLICKKGVKIVRTKINYSEKGKNEGTKNKNNTLVK